jgi:hypothetical protein
MHWIFGAISLALALGLGIYTRSLKPSVFRAQLTYNEESFRRVLAQWTPEGREVFAAHFRADYLFLVAYAGFGYFLARHLAPGPGVLPSWLMLVFPWLLPVAAAFDATENILHQRFLSALPGALPAFWFVVSGVAASAKWLLVVIFIVVVAASYLATSAP